MKRKTLFVFAATALVGMAAVSCEGDYNLNDTQINTAVRLISDEITATDAVIDLSPTQDVASFIVAGPVVNGTFNYAGADAISKLNWIKENGQTFEAPYSVTHEKLVPGTTYMMGFVALNDKGTVVSAPSFGTFTTKTIGVTVKAAMTGKTAPFNYTFSIEPNEYTPSFKYITSYDPAIVNADDADIEALVKAGGAGVETSKVTVEESESRDEKEDFIVAALPFDKVGRAGNISIARVYTSDMVSVVCNGRSTNLKQPDKSVMFFTGEVDLPAKSTFTISNNGVQYGYTSFSGNGGVGELEEHPNMASPAKMFSLTTYKKYAYKAIGRMTEMEDGGNAFWTNMSKDCKVKVTADFTATDGIPRYRFDIVETDPNVILRENFELFVAGGYYWVCGSNDMAKGPGYENNDPAVIDGTEPVIQDKIGYTEGGTLMLTSPGIEPTESSNPCEAYIKNRDLAGWSYERVYEHALAIRVGKSSKSYITTYLTTPEFSALTAGSTISVEVILSRMGGGADPISVGVIGSGSISGASYSIHTGASNVDAGSKITAGEFMADAEVCPVIANADRDKPVTTVTLTINNAGPDTRISVYPCKENTNISDSRFYCHGITITKK